MNRLESRKKALTSKYRARSQTLSELTREEEPWVVLTIAKEGQDKQAVRGSIKQGFTRRRSTTEEELQKEIKGPSPSAFVSNNDNYINTNTRPRSSSTSNVSSITLNNLMLIDDHSAPLSPTSAVRMDKNDALNNSNLSSGGTSMVHQLCASANPSLEMIRM